MGKLENQSLIDFYYDKYNLPDLFSKNIKPYMELFIFNRNEYICTEHQRVDYIFFLVKGSAKVYTTLSNGKSHLLCFNKPLKVLGELEFVSSKEKPYNVQVLEDSYCIGIHMHHVKEHLLDDVKFFKCLCSSLGEKLYSCSANSSINLLCQLESRLASYILATAIERNDNKITTLYFDENLTHTAELLGTSYRHLLRMISSFCTRGILRKSNNVYEVINKMLLQKLSIDSYK